ncbi:MAG TPA: response regulator [Sphingobium sp.]|nr:response regulator [Sphingobium sp.]
MRTFSSSDNPHRSDNPAKPAGGPAKPVRGRGRSQLPDKLLSNCSILVVEDEYLLADEVAKGLRSFGADIVGPCPSQQAAYDLVDHAGHIDGALLDINLRGVQAFELADFLQARGIPVVFATGYEPAILPPRFASVPRCVKPLRMNAIARALKRRIKRS